MCVGGYGPRYWSEGEKVWNNKMGGMLEECAQGYDIKTENWA